jgi:UDP-GlcNAc:undecaprenyl-phosphate/decaprenyl-phosphate GlcNAc-1-phosphate transferase
MSSPFFFILLSISTALAIVGCLNAPAIGQRFGLLDHPDQRKTHRQATPLMGGLAIVGSFAPLCFVYILEAFSPRWMLTLIIWLSVVVIVSILGIIDDRKGLSPRTRLSITFLVFGAASAIDPTFNVRVLDFLFPAVSLGLGTWWLAIIFTVVCLVGLLNAVNMADGKNGLVIGLCLGWLGLLATRAPEPLLPVFLLLIANCLVLFVFNLRGRLFLGDGGAYGLATAVGLLAIITYNSPGSETVRSVSADELVLLFSVPVIDSFRLTFLRMLRGQSPMAPDRDHLHHIMQSKFGWPLGLMLYYIIALLPSAVVFLNR